MSNLNSIKKFKIGFVSILTIFILLTMFIVIAIPVSACYYIVGTFESDFSTSKDSFFNGQTAYCKGGGGI